MSRGEAPRVAQSSINSLSLWDGYTIHFVHTYIHIVSMTRDLSTTLTDATCTLHAMVSIGSYPLLPVLYVTVYAKIGHMSGKTFFELALDFINTMLFTPL